MISGKTTLIAHLGYPTESFKAPMIYNPWFDQQGIDAVVMPMGVKAEDYAVVLASLFKLTNIRGALVTMPHKITTLSLVDEATPTAKIAGACNAILKRPDGTLLGDQFDGAGFVRGVQRKGRRAGRRAGAGVGQRRRRFGDRRLAGRGRRGRDGALRRAAASSEALAGRLRAHYPQLVVTTGSNDPAGFDLVVNATPLGMKEGDPLPFDVARIAPSTFVGEVVMKSEYTPLLRAVRDKGCAVQVGTDMLFEMIPAYLEFFGFGSATPEDLRAVATLAY